jgi:hypothetical protein
MSQTTDSYRSGTPEPEELLYEPGSKVFGALQHLEEEERLCNWFPDRYHEPERCDDEPEDYDSDCGSYDDMGWNTHDEELTPLEVYNRQQMLHLKQDLLEECSYGGFEDNCSGLVYDGLGFVCN